VLSPETYTYSLDEVQTILATVPEPAATAFAVAAFAGLRRGEIEGLDWSNYGTGSLWVERSIWNGHIEEPKTEKSKGSVPVIRQLAELLDRHKLRCGNPAGGPIFANCRGGRLNMNNLRNRMILPALNRCVHCGLSEGKPHRKQNHVFERDPRLPEWHGFHAARRGLGSNLFHLGVPDKVIQAILRHSNVNVTLGYYVKSASPQVLAGMRKLEERLGDPVPRDTYGTLKPGSGTVPESIN
jgi:integrase